LSEIGQLEKKHHITPESCVSGYQPTKQNTDTVPHVTSTSQAHNDADQTKYITVTLVL